MNRCAKDYFYYCYLDLGVIKIAYIFNSSSWKVEAGKSLQIQGQPGQQRELQDSQDYTNKGYLVYLFKNLVHVLKVGGTHPW